MKKRVIFLVLGILLISLVTLTIAKNDKITAYAANESNNTNMTDGNNTQGSENNGTNSNATEGNTTSGEAVRKTVVNMTRTRIQNRTNLTFSPYQKRNESECMDGCECNGAVVSCRTETGKTMMIQAGRSGNFIVITVDKTNASTELELEQELNEDNETVLNAMLSSGEKRQVKVLPDQAAERAREKLKVGCTEGNNCSLELTEEDQQLRYEMQIERHSRILGIFSKKMRIQAEINAENGETEINKPWWAFLASEPEE